MGKLDNKTVVVTGASRGIGEEIAKVFAAEGGRVVCAARTLREGEHQFAGSLESTVAAIKEAGGEATAVAVNISEPEECEKLIEAARARLRADRCDGEQRRADVLRPDQGLPDQSLDALVGGELPRAVHPQQARRWRTWSTRKSGSIVNISSGAAIGPGRGPYPGEQMLGGGTCYGAEKAALERFTQGLASEVYQYGISVTCVSPSQVVPTPGTVHHRLVRGLDDPRGEHPELMAKAALLLATEPLDKVTGRVTYSQQILKEFGWIDKAVGLGVDSPRAGSGYSQI